MAVSKAIALHTTPEVPRYKQPEVRLVRNRGGLLGGYAPQAGDGVRDDEHRHRGDRGRVHAAQLLRLHPESRFET
jgi:hypothetical protein